MKKWKISKSNQKIIDLIDIDCDWRLDDDEENPQYYVNNGKDVEQAWVLELYLPIGKCFEPGQHCDVNIGNNKQLAYVLTLINDCCDPECEWCHSNDNEEE